MYIVSAFRRTSLVRSVRLSGGPHTVRLKPDTTCLSKSPRAMHCHHETRFDSAIRPLPTVTEAERLDFCDPDTRPRRRHRRWPGLRPRALFSTPSTAPSPATNSPPLVCRNPYTASAIPPANRPPPSTAYFFSMFSVSQPVAAAAGRTPWRCCAGDRRPAPAYQSDNQHPRDEDRNRSHVVSLWPTLREKRGCLEPVAHCPDRRLGRPRF